MKERQELKKHITKIGVLVFAIVIIGISLSYAYYSANISGRGEIPSTNAARLDLTSTLTDSKAINNLKLTLIDASTVKEMAEKVEFSVTNADTSTVNGKYYVYLTDVHITKNLYSKYFKWELVRVTGNIESQVSTGDFTNAVRMGSIVEGEDEKVLTDIEDIGLNKVALQIEPGNTDQYIFRLWLENDPVNNQIELTEGSFQGKLKIEATPTK